LQRQRELIVTAVDFVCCNLAPYNKTLLRHAISVSRESTLIKEGTMANGEAFRQQGSGGAKLEQAAEKFTSLGGATKTEAKRLPPANDNHAEHDLPPCLPVTDAEVTLLHRYLSREILGLFS
jgi:hypothetical protein